MKVVSAALRLFAVLLLAAAVSSCASTGTGSDVDATPTLRTSVDAHIGKSWSPDSSKIENISKEFAPTEPVLAIIDIPTKIDGTIRVRWIFNGTETVGEQSMALQSGVNVYPFRLNPPEGGHKSGEYRLEVFVNNDRAETESFTVRAS